MRRLLVVALTGVAVGAAATGGAGASGADARTAASPRPASKAVTAATGARERRRAVRRVRRRGRGRAHIPAWVLRRGPLPGSIAVPGLTAPALQGTAPGTGGSGTPAGGSGGTPSTPTAGGTPPAPTCGYAVGAKETEWAITLTRTKLCAGKVTIEAQNWGEDPHDMWFQIKDGPVLWKFGEDPPHLAPLSGGTPGIESKQLTLAPGSYELYCSLTGGTPPGTPGGSHAAAGMQASLTVVTP